LTNRLRSIKLTTNERNTKNTRRYSMLFHVVLEEAEDGWIVAGCPSLPGCVSQGRDEKEALDNIKEAITAWLWAEDQKALEKIPAYSKQEAIVVSV
jgi:predicted RNase H-like HicB family nuclease